MLTFAAFCGLALITAAPATAGEEEAAIAQPATRPFKFQAEIFGRGNPFGLVFQVGGSYRRELAQAAGGRPHPYLQAGLGLSGTPASATTSAHLEWMQRPFLVVRVRGDLYRYFGTSGVLLEFPSKDSAFGSGEIDARSGRELSRFAERLLIQPTLRARLGSLFLQSQTDLAWFRFGDGGPYFYERGYDTLLKDGDRLVANRTAVMAPLWSQAGVAKLLVGPAYELQRSFAAGLQRQRLGVAFQLSPTTRLGPLLSPRIAVQSGVYLQDRNRRGRLFALFQIGVDVWSR